MDIKRESTKSRHDHATALFNELLNAKQEVYKVYKNPPPIDILIGICIYEVAHQTHYKPSTIETIISGKYNYKSEEHDGNREDNTPQAEL